MAPDHESPIFCVKPVQMRSPCALLGWFLTAIAVSLGQGNRIWSLRLLKAGSTSWGSGAINSDRGCRNAEEPASVRSFARRKGSSAVNHLPDFSYAIALPRGNHLWLRPAGRAMIGDVSMPWGLTRN